MLIKHPIALRKAKIEYNFGLSDCNRVLMLIPGLNLTEDSYADVWNSMGIWVE